MTYSDAFGRRVRLGDEPPNPRSNSCGRDRFKPAPCSEAGGLVSLVSKGAGATAGAVGPANEAATTASLLPEIGVMSGSTSHLA